MCPKHPSTNVFASCSIFPNPDDGPHPSHPNIHANSSGFMTRPLLRQTIAALFSLGLGLATSLYAHAQEETTEEPRINFSGFGTLGAVHVRGGGAAVVRDMMQLQGADNQGISWAQNTRLGVQASMNLTENLEATAQVVSRYGSDNNFDPEVTWGFIKYTPNDFLELRAGRVGFDTFLFADSRDVGYSYLWTHPPLEHFGALFVPFIDGSDIVLRTPLGRGVGRFKLYTGLSRQKVTSMMGQHQWADNITTGPIGSIDDLGGSRMTGGHIEYQDDHWLLRLGHAQMKHQKSFPPGSFNLRGYIAAEGASALAGDPANGIAPNPLLGNAALRFVEDSGVAGKKITFDSIAMAYEDGPLQMQMAASRIKGDSLLFPNYKSGYAAVGYRIDRITPYALVSTIRSKMSDRASELQRLGASAGLVSVTSFTLQSPLTTQTTYSLGMRYEYSDTIALKFQADFTRNKDCSPVALPLGSTPACAPPLLWPTVPVNWNGRAQTYSATLDFIF